MSAKSTIKEEKKEEVVDDISALDIELNTLKALKAKLKAQAQSQSKEPVQTQTKYKKEMSLDLGIIGVGQAGGNLASAMYELGYNVVAINTASQDIKYINIPETNKLLLTYTMGGCAKDIQLGKEAAEANKEEIKKFIDDKLSNTHVHVLCASLGGGTGSGSSETLIDILYSLGKPIVMITVLPMETEDAQTKANALETLSKLVNLTKVKKINNLIVVDNSKLETIYHNISQIDFFSVANKAIVSPIDAFNTLSVLPSSVKPLDTSEWAKLFTDGEGLSVMGELVIDNYKEDTAIAEAVINNLDSNLLATGFDLKQSKYVGVIIAASKAVWKQIPSSSVNYAMAMIDDVCGSPQAVFKGIYTVETNDDNVKVYSIFSGLGIPVSRTDQLRKDAQEYMQKAKAKEDHRGDNLKLDTGIENTVSDAQKIKDKINKKSSAFGKLVVDRRK